MPTKQEILDWLDRAGKKRSYLAERCGVGKQQVYNWFAKNGVIPENKLKAIQFLMSEDSKNSSDSTSSSNTGKITAVAVVFSSNEFEEVKKAAEKLGMTIEEFIRSASLDK